MNINEDWGTAIFVAQMWSERLRVGDTICFHPSQSGVPGEAGWASWAMRWNGEISEESSRDGCGVDSWRKKPPICAYKNLIRTRRASWRIISNKEENEGGDGRLKMIWEYQQMVETELQLICCDILGVLDKPLIPAPNIGWVQALLL